MLKVYISILTLLLTPYVPAPAYDVRADKIKDLTNNSSREWILLDADGKRMGGPEKMCPKWTFYKSDMQVTQQESPCSRRGNDKTYDWDIHLESPDVILKINDIKYHLRFADVENSDTKLMYLEIRSGERDKPSSLWTFAHYPK